MRCDSTNINIYHYHHYDNNCDNDNNIKNGNAMIEQEPNSCISQERKKAMSCPANIRSSDSPSFIFYINSKIPQINYKDNVVPYDSENEYQSNMPQPDYHAFNHYGTEQSNPGYHNNSIDHNNEYDTLPPPEIKIKKNQLSKIQRMSIPKKIGFALIFASVPCVAIPVASYFLYYSLFPWSIAMSIFLMSLSFIWVFSSEIAKDMNILEFVVYKIGKFIAASTSLFIQTKDTLKDNSYHQNTCYNEPYHDEDYNNDYHRYKNQNRYHRQSVTTSKRRHTFK